MKNTTTIVKSWRLIIHNENILPTRGCQAVADVINCHLMSNNRFLEKLPGPSGGRDSNRLEETKRESVQQCCPAVLTSSKHYSLTCECSTIISFIKSCTIPFVPFPLPCSKSEVQQNTCDQPRQLHQQQYAMEFLYQSMNQCQFLTYH